MGRAIGIRVHKKEGEQRLDASKFFGAPTIPLSWENDFYEDEIFFCQIRLEDIKEYDTENKLPHKGYLYIFLDTEEGDYSLRARVRYYDGKPELALLSFNETVEGYEYLNEEWQMEFYDAEEDTPSTRLFGVPSDWNYEDSPPELLLQFDPLDTSMGFLEFLDGFVYFFFGDDKRDFENVFITEEYS